ncbi:Chromatin modification-related protein EAF3 [Wickerhamiella sorbophila]|uniref:Chromatin modification-related protein EAF3 n=1 Tax=Wickerhamiella sorbophila TaxID=45607 RepID=A0A2T0FI61_9ASCO|nr:Chromatin modification-related protein EAF3 [Wickerhamiella sorbophila]PRT54684.1 Chromatin modification-related protein EAF3 [Wickerhamiella sorbophila]
MDVDVLEVGSRCLAFHGPLLYEAKVLKVFDATNRKVIARSASSESGGVEVSKANGHHVPKHILEGDTTGYFVHYKGWKSTWDEWIGQDRVLSWNEDNLKVQKELKQAALASQKKINPSNSVQPHTSKSNKRRSEAEREVTPKKDDRALKRSRGPTHEPDIEREVDYQKRPAIEIAIPTSLKSKLVDDWEFITKDHKLVPLPRTPCVNDILVSYAEEHLGESTFEPQAEYSEVSGEKQVLKEFLSGLKLYFNRSLGSLLLYRFERQQYFDFRRNHTTVEPAAIYGAEHLLRLFVSFPGLLAYTSMDTQAVDVLRALLEGFMRWLMKHEEFFVTEYEDTTGTYEARSRGV